MRSRPTFQSARRNDRRWRELDADANRAVVLSAPGIGAAATGQAELRDRDRTSGARVRHCRRIRAAQGRPADTDGDAAMPLAIEQHVGQGLLVGQRIPVRQVVVIALALFN
nr:hypothetical protein [uncultured Rhodopila sp.]